MNTKLIDWVLRVGVAGEFVGHGTLALQGKAQWVGWIVKMLGVSQGAATEILFVIGLMDIAVALFALAKPVRGVLLWAAVWGFWTALVRPIVGESALDFIERWANWSAPLALLLMRGWPRSAREWFSS